MPGDLWANPHHRLVNTTPKPNATKNSNGELEFLFLSLSSLAGDVVAAGGSSVAVAAA